MPFCKLRFAELKKIHYLCAVFLHVSRHQMGQTKRSFKFTHFIDCFFPCFLFIFPSFAVWQEVGVLFILCRCVSKG